MNLRIVALAVAAVFASAVCATAQPGDLPRVGVLDLTSENVSPAEVRLLSDRLRHELFNTGRFRIMERERVEDILREQAFQRSGCVSTECAVEVGQLISAQQMVLGSVNRMGSVYTISLRLVNVQTGALERVVVKDCWCSLEEVLRGVIEQAAIELANLGFGRVQVVSSPRGATVSSTPAGISGTTPLALDKVPEGQYLLRLSMPQHVAHEQTVEVMSGELTTVNATLQYAFGRLRINSTPSRAGISSSPMGITGTTPYWNDRVEPGRYRVTLRMADRTPYEQTVEVMRDQTTTINAKLPLYPDIIRARRARIKAGSRWTSLACAVVATGVAYKFERDAKSAYDERNEAYERYQGATTTAEAIQWRQKHDDATRRGDNAAKKRNVLYGVAGGTFGLGIVLWVW